MSDRQKFLLDFTPIDGSSDDDSSSNELSSAHSSLLSQTDEPVEMEVIQADAMEEAMEEAAE